MVLIRLSNESEILLWIQTFPAIFILTISRHSSFDLCLCYMLLNLNSSSLYIFVCRILSGHQFQYAFSNTYEYTYASQYGSLLNPLYVFMFSVMPHSWHLKHVLCHVCKEKIENISQKNCIWKSETRKSGNRKRDREKSTVQQCT